MYGNKQICRSTSIKPEHLLIRIYILLLLLILVLLALRWFLKTPSTVLARYFRYLGLAAIIVIMLFLVATSRLNWLFALFGVALAFIVRLLPVLLRYAPYLQKFWYTYRTNKQGTVNGLYSFADHFFIIPTCIKTSSAFLPSTMIRTQVFSFARASKIILSGS